MAITLPGWSCTWCGVFNGEAKEELERCRACDEPKDKPRPPLGDPKCQACKGLGHDYYGNYCSWCHP